MSKVEGNPFLHVDFKSIQFSFSEIKDELSSEMNFSKKHWEIIEAAIRVFSEKGFSAGRTSEIAKEACVSEGTIFNYFKTKNDLLQALLLPFFQLVTRPFILNGIDSFLTSRPEIGVEEGLANLALDRVKLIEEHRGLVKTVFAETMFHPELFESIREKILPVVVEATQTIFDSEVERGTFRKVDSLATMKVFMGMIFAHATFKQLKLFSENYDQQDDEVEIRRMIDILLYGVSTNQTTHFSEVCTK
ncbi:TetR/AcrR family transcriptional regulator [Neobacillus ginsengisoli]|uniref:AcrR family transcriptional regulator n=1 Tax=Neobacillus ginsengisoli TaxID=904295 RepID=A0ABT9XWZ6_9BACI|nr:TetR/AcrR family transcriptional regulator [Neobacillus ginsengisoli]MDQ0200087.1 AcrR family transcriptional regulator [Neobacillus ginsengisoli]